MSVSIMKKLTAITPLRDTDRVLRRLLRMRCAEIRTLPTDELEGGGQLLRCDCEAARAAAERRVADVDTVLHFLEGYATTPRPWRKKPIDITTEVFESTGCRRAAEVVVEEVLAIREARAEAQAETRRTEEMRAALQPWLDYDDVLTGADTALCELWLGTMPDGVSPASVADGADSPEVHIALHEVSHRMVGKGKAVRYVTALVLKKESAEALRVLSEAGFERISFRDLPLPEETARENDKACIKRLGELENQLQAHADRLRYLSGMLDDIAVLYDMEMTTLNALREKEKLLTTNQCALIEAWVPADRSERVMQALYKLPCAFDMTDPAPDEEPPILLKNNKFASNFEWVVGMYAYPKYGTYDPTFIMSIFYFFIFGIMFADVGYGALLLVGGFLLPKVLHMKDGMKQMLNMFGWCGISCILLGFVFGGWFGDMPYAIMTNFLGYESVEAAKEAFPIFNGLVVTLGGSPISLNPLENPMAFLVVSLAIGAIHLIGGMAVKFVLLCKEGKVFAAVFDVGSYWVLFAGFGLLVVNTTAAWVTIGVGALMIVCTNGRTQKNIVMKFLMGLKGLYDLINYASDLLSYCRILALGLAAGVVGQVINLLATMGGPTPAGFILLVLVMLIGHALNMAINILGAFVHTSRLQYLEFFGKFYEDGGVAFNPALPSDKYSTVEADGQPDAADTH